MLTKTSIQVRTVTTPADKELFLDVPARVYANDPHWVPPIRSSIAKQFESSNPFFQYGKLQQFIALSEESSPQPLGRIVAAVNQRLNEREGKNVGLFGFFECISDFDVAQALLETASVWLREQGMTVVRGPIDLSTHNSCLFLVDGFESPPMIMTSYNPPYYPQFLEQAGWYKAKDAYAYDFPLDKPLPTEFEKAYRIACKSGVNFRPIRIKGEAFDEDALGLYRLLNTTFSNNWSFTPRTESEFLEEAKSLQSLVDPDVFPVAEYNGEMIGCFMGLPNYNIALKHIAGKLNWLGILKFLWYRRQIDQGRVIVVCSLPEYRRKMVPLALIYLGMQGGIKKGKPYKTYRIYEKAL